MAFLIVARIKVPSTERLEIPDKTISRRTAEGKQGLPKAFWFYTIFAFLSIAGYTHFQIISYHFKKAGIVPDAHIPIFYAVAMGVDGIVALIVGKIYDRVGLKTLLAIPLMTLPIPFLAFSHNHNIAFISVIFWGAVMGIHETIMRAAIADLTPLERRGSAYGIFNTAYGASWFIGSTLTGFLYDFSINWLILFVVLVEVISIAAFFLLKIGNIKITQKT
jgi:predicted MFS family arabinose efflux permease